MDISTFLTTIGISSIITLILTKLWDLWREKVKIKNEDRKLLRKALTSLTNLWQSLLIWDFENHVNITSDLLFEQFTTLGVNSEKLKEIKLKETDKSKIVTLQVQTATEKLKLLDEQISNVVEKLSEIKPLIASELHDLQSSTPLQSMEKAVKDNLDDGNARDEYSFNMIGELQNQFFQAHKARLTERIKPYILLIAEEIDEKTLKDTKVYLEAREKERLEFLANKKPDATKEFVKQMTEMLLTAHFKSSKDTLPNTENQPQDNLKNSNVDKET